MNKTKKIIVGSAITLVVLLVAITIFLYILLTKSIPETEGHTNLEGLKSEVNVFRNEYGIPHIIAGNDHDLMFTLGYTTAQDRLWQMDLQRRLGEGKLSEIFGEETLEIDALMRTIGFGRIANNIKNNLSKESLDILQAYADGVNAYINKNRKKLQIEFDLLGYDPEPWKIEHSLIILRLFAWQMSLGWWSDLVNSDIIKKIGVTKAGDIIPEAANSSSAIYSSRDNLSEDMMKTTMFIKKVFGVSSLAGSNAWVLSGQKSTTGHPILANDPHLILSAPSVWYQVSLHSPDMDVTGLSLPGIPGVIIGSNGKTSWGITNGMVDDCDFFSETTDSLGLNKYSYDNSWNNLTIINEKIAIKNSTPIDYIIYCTNKGPIISNFTDIKVSYDFRKQNLRIREAQPPKGKQVSMRWCGFETSDEILGLYMLNKSRSVIEIEEAIKHIKSPALNFLYCDDVNIGQKLCGLVPIRNYSSAHTILPGTTSEYSWKGFISYPDLPSSSNPDQKFIASANYKFNSSFYISNLWENDARFNRITELLNSKDKFSLEDMQKFQTDDISLNAKILLPVLISILEKYNKNDYYYSQSLTYLKNWDCSMDKSSISASIFNVLCFRILKNTIADELGDDLFSKFCFVAFVPTNAITKLITENKTSWFDDVNTPGRFETMDEIINKSMMEAIEYLKSNLGGETKNWRWGELHKLTLKHPFSKQKPLDKIFNIGPYETDGTNTTINCGYFDFNDPYCQVIGPSARFTVDMSNPQLSYSVISSGVSGQPFSLFYSDQIKLMLEGNNIMLNNSRDKIESSGYKRLHLMPK